MRLHRHAILSTLIIALSAHLDGQVSRHISSVKVPASTVQDAATAISVEILPTVQVSRALLRYRSFGVTEFTELEMLEAGRSFTATIPAEAMQPPYVQYYVVLELRDGSIATYPEAAPDINPLQLTVQQQDPREREVIFLSPEPGETVAQEEFILALSLYYATPAVAPNRTRILYDGVDVSRESILSDDVILWSPANSAVPIQLGSHTVRVELRDTLGNLYWTKERSFNLSTTAAIVEQQSQFQYNGDVRAEYRNEQTQAPQTYARLETRANGSYGFMTFGGNLRLDNLEDPSRQPQNRYYFFADAEYARIELGDAYPSFPSLMMIGKRVRGISGSINTGVFNLDVSVGKTQRAVEGVVLGDTTYADSNGVLTRPLESIRKGASYFTYELFSPGAYDRDFIGVRPSFGSGENFQLGFTYLKFKDDLGSVRYSVQPKENLVVGADLKLGFDDQRIRWETQVAVGLQNKDISGGNFTDAEYDSLKAQGQDVKDLGKLAEQFITVNANLEPLNPAGTGMPGLALESFLTLNYFDNYIRAQFIRRGTGYKSFGNEFLQSDIQGFTISDNIRLLSNRLFGSVSYEARSDNLSDTKSGTTKYNNISTAITYNAGAGLPTFQVGYGLNSRVNDGIIFTPDTANPRSSKAAEDDATRLSIGLSYDLTGPFRNFITLNVSTIDRADKTIYKRDQKSSLIQGSVASYFTIPLRTTLSFITSSTKSFNQTFATTGVDSTLDETVFDFTSVGIGAEYQVGTALRFQLQVAPTFGDVKRTNLRLGGDYSVRNHIFELLVDYFNNADTSDDTILSFIYRYNF